MNYIVSEFKKVGLKPGNTDGTYIQKVPLVGITPDAGAARRSRRARRQQHAQVEGRRRGVDEARGADRRALDNSELVFVGYGVVAPEFNWDDYKGVDVKGKTLVMLVNDPPVPDPANPDELDPKTFGGKAMTYYGRWTYKYEIGAREGRGRRAHRSRDRTGRLSVRRRAGQGRRAVRSRDAGQEHGPRGDRGVDDARRRRRRCSRWPARTSTR